MKKHLLLTLFTGITLYSNEVTTEFDKSLREKIMIQTEFIKTKNKLKEVNKTKKLKIQDLFKDLNTTSALETYLNDYNKRSYKVPRWAINSIIKHSKNVDKEYNVDYTLILAIAIRESGFRYDLNHKPVKTKVYGELKTVQAKGLTGIIFDFHAKRLKKAHIYRGDLFDIHQNLRACAIILKHYRVDKNKKRALAKFYGANNYKYAQEVIAIQNKLKAYIN